MKNRQFLYVSSLVLSLLATSTTFAGHGQFWRTSKGDIHGNGKAENSNSINASNVNQLQVQWTYLTTPDILDGSGDGANGSIHSAPSIAGKYLYFTDATGRITALNRKTGTVIWSKRFVDDISNNGEIYYSRNTPAISKNRIVVGSAIHFASQLCTVTQALGLPGLPANGVLGPYGFNCHLPGAYVVALDRFTGNKIWETKVSDHPFAKISGSVNIVGNTVYVPVGGWEEEATRAHPNVYDLNGYPGVLNFLTPAQIDVTQPYPCCSSTGKAVALDLKTGAIKWSTDLAIGIDKNNTLSPALKAALGPKGLFGAATYGDTPTVDVKRRQVYFATANTYMAPPIMEACEVARRQFLIANPTNQHLSLLAPPNNLQLPQGVATCNDLNSAFKTYNGAIVALDSRTGAVKWAYYARHYDPWVHACDGPNLQTVYAIPVLVPDPLGNLANCPNLPGPDYGFGNQPMLIKNVSATTGGDLVVAGNKDGYIYAVNPDTGALVWKRKVAIGGIYGGVQFGMATDGQRIFTGSVSANSMGHAIQREFRSAQSFLDVNFNNNPNFTALGDLRFKAGLVNSDEGAALEQRAAPADLFIPFPGPQIGLSSIFPGPTRGAGYPNGYPVHSNNQIVPNTFSPFLTGPTSGPKELLKLVNPPVDDPLDGNPPTAVKSNCVNVFDRPINRDNPGPDLAACVVGKTGAQSALYTHAGTIQAINVKDGTILWQRPAIDGIGAVTGLSGVYAPPTVVNGVVFIGYADTKGTLVGLDANTGKLKFKFNAKIAIDNAGTTIPSGTIAGAPSVVNGNVYWGIGSDTFGPFGANYPGNRLYSFGLKGVTEPDSEVEQYDENASTEEDEDWPSE